MTPCPGCRFPLDEQFLKMAHDAHRTMLVCPHCKMVVAVYLDLTGGNYGIKKGQQRFHLVGI
jgi:hypothetical protein